MKIVSAAVTILSVSIFIPQAVAQEGIVKCKYSARDTILTLYDRKTHNRQILGVSIGSFIAMQVYGCQDADDSCVIQSPVVGYNDMLLVPRRFLKDCDDALVAAQSFQTKKPPPAVLDYDQPRPAKK